MAVLFAPYAPPEQLPLLDGTETSEEARREHMEYLMPPPVAVYSAAGLSLCGVGVFRKDDSFFYKDDVLPSYFRSFFMMNTEKLPDVWEGMTYQPNAPVRSIDKPCFYAFHPNLVYGHFLLEILPKLYIWRFLKTCGYQYSFLLPRDLPAWARAFVDLFVDEGCLDYHDPAREVVRAPRFILASMMHVDHNFHPAFNLALEYAVRASREGRSCVGQTTTPRRLYLSRRRAHTGWHAILNEDEVEGVFADLGFTIVHPQELSIREQICLYAGAEVIAGEYSSALHNSIFSPAGTKVISLNRVNWYQSRIGRLRQQPIVYISPADGRWRDWRAHKGRADFTMDCDRVRHVVSTVLETPARATKA
jgi:hypothetical protein